MRSHLPTLLLAAALSSIALPAPAVAQPSSLKPISYRATTIPCPALTEPDEVEGKTIVCGVLLPPLPSPIRLVNRKHYSPKAKN